MWDKNQLEEFHDDKREERAFVTPQPAIIFLSCQLSFESFENTP